METYSFDLFRIFFGELPPMIYVEIIIRTIFLFIYMILLLRITPQRNIGQLSPTDLLIVIALGSAVGDPMFYPEIPVLHGVTVVTVIFAINYILENLGVRSAKVETLIQGKPTCLITNGLLEVDNLMRSNITREDIFMELRLNQYDSLGQIKRAYVETNGQISLIPFEKSHIIEPSIPVIPPRDALKLKPLGREAHAEYDGIYGCYSCGYTKNMKEGQALAVCQHCAEDQWYYLKDLVNATS